MHDPARLPAPRDDRLASVRAQLADRRWAMRELPPEDRPRERLAARGAAGLSNAELVALVWGTGSRGRTALDLAIEALAEHDGLAGLSRASVVELEAIPGVGAARAARLVAGFELGRRLLADGPSGRLAIRGPRDLADRLMLQMGRLEREELRVVLLNTKNVVLAVETVYRGNVSASLVRVGELFRDAVRQHAARRDPRPQPSLGRPDAERPTTCT